MAWRVARSLEKLLAQVNATYPGRSKASDGTIGDTLHASRTSDHNPNAAGVVTAMDITHDPVHGLDSEKLANALLSSRDSRIKYIISNRKIAASYKVGTTAPWVWRPYSGTNAHNKHCHVSVSSDSSKYDDTSPWNLLGRTGVVHDTTPVPNVKNTWDESITKVLAHEGGYVDDPRDVGNATNMGITLATYRQHVSSGATKDDLRRMTIDRAKFIYRVHYWNALGCDALPAGLDYAIFDFGVNSGIDRAAKMLQEIVGVHQDGHVGPATLDGVKRYGDMKKLIDELCSRRMSYLRTRSNWNVYRIGWTTRVTQVQTDAKKMADRAASSGAKAITTGVIVTTTGGTAITVSEKKEGGFDWWYLLPIVIVGLSIAVVTWFVWPKKDPMEV